MAQGGQNKTLADEKPDAVAPTPSQGPADPHPTGMESKALGFLPALLQSSFTAYSGQVSNTSGPKKLTGPV